MAGKGQKRYWKAMLDKKTGEIYRIPDYGYPVTINGRQFFCNLTQCPEYYDVVTDEYTGRCDYFGMIKDHFEKYLELSSRGVDVMTLPEKPKSEGNNNGDL